MSYSVDELFRFEKTKGGYSIDKYLKTNDPTITEIEIPAEYNGEPVTEIAGFCPSKYIKRVIIPPSVRRIGSEAFWKCEGLETAELSEGLEVIGADAFEETNLKSIVLPKSLKRICSEAFMLCTELEHVEFNSSPTFEPNVFGDCPKLPPETVAMGLVRSTDITSPLLFSDILELTEFSPGLPDCFRPDVFELLAKNDCFRNWDRRLRYLFYIMIEENKAELFPVAEQYGMLEDAELLDMLLSYAIESQTTEITAYLLDLKNRKFGFNGGNKFEL